MPHTAESATTTLDYTRTLTTTSFSAASQHTSHIHQLSTGQQHSSSRPHHSTHTSFAGQVSQPPLQHSSHHSTHFGSFCQALHHTTHHTPHQHYTPIIMFAIFGSSCHTSHHCTAIHSSIITSFTHPHPIARLHGAPHITGCSIAWVWAQQWPSMHHSTCHQTAGFQHFLSPAQQGFHIASSHCIAFSSHTHTFGHSPWASFSQAMGHSRHWQVSQAGHQAFQAAQFPQPQASLGTTLGFQQTQSQGHTTTAGIWQARHFISHKAMGQAKDTFNQGFQTPFKRPFFNQGAILGKVPNLQAGIQAP